MTTPVISDALLNRLTQIATDQDLTPDQLLSQLLDQYQTNIPWQAVFNSIPASSAVVDARQPDYPLVAVNQSFIDKTGYTKAEVIGHNCRFLQGDDRDQEDRHTIRQALKSGTTCTARLRNYRKDGSMFWNKLSIWPLKNNAGEVTHFVANQIDISDEVAYYQALQSSENRYQQFVESANEGIWAVDLEGKTLFVNQQITLMLGYTAQDLQTLTLWDIAHEDDRAYIEANLEVRRQGHSEQHDFRFIHKDGHDIWVLINTNPLFNEAGEVYGALGFISDITRRVEAEQQLAASEARYKHLTAIMTDYVFSISVDADGTLHNEWVAGAYEEIVGYEPPETHSPVLFKRVHPNDLPKLNQNIKKLIANEATTIQYRIYHKTGHVVWLEVSSQPIWDEQQGRVVRILNAANDVTTRIEAELELKTSENRLRIISEMTSDYAFTFIVNPDGTIKRDWITAPSMERITGYTPEESKARGGWATLAHPDDVPKIQASLAKLLTEETYTITKYRIVTKSGAIRHMEGLNRSIADDSGKITYILGSARDITEAHNIQLEIIESEARFRTMANSAPVLIWVSDTEKQCTYFNETWLNFTGRTLDQELGFGWAQGVHPDDYERCIDIYVTAFDARESFSMDYRLKRHDGLYRWVQDDAIPRFLPNGEFAGYVGSCIDITEQRETQQELERLVAERTEDLQSEIERRREAEANLQRERDLLHNTMQTSPSAIFVIGVNGLIRFASEAANKLLMEPNEATLNPDIHSPLWDVRDRDGKNFLPGEMPLDHALATGQTLYDQQVSFINGIGERRLLSLNLAPLHNPDGTITEVIVTAEDITLRKESEQSMEAALQQERQLNRIRSRFISTITHEFKTPLAIIQTSCDIIRRQHSKLNTVQLLERVERIEKQGKQLNLMVDDIVQLNQTDRSDYTPYFKMIDLHTFIQRITDDILFAYNNKVRVQFDFALNHQQVLIDENLASQILSNLIGNAVKYTPKGNSISVTTRYDGHQLKIIVSDEGIGIPTVDLPYLFDDFFRASNTGNIPGTGIGLATVKRAVELLKGQINVTSVEGKGTSFTVSLPLIAEVR